MSEPSPRPTWVRWRVVLLLMAFSFLAHFNRISMSAAGDMRIMKQYSIPPDAMGRVYTAFLLFYTIGMAPGGLFVDRVGARAALVATGLGSAAFCALTGGVGTGWVAAGAVLPALVVVRSLMGLVNAPVYPGAGRAVMQWMPFSQRALANGLVVGAAPLGDAGAYVLTGALIDQYDWPMTFVITGGITALVAAMWGLYATERPSRHAGVNARELAMIERALPERGPSKTEAAGGVRAVLGDRNVWLLTLVYAASGYFQYLFFYWMHYYFKEVLHLGEQVSRYYAGIPPLAMALTLPLGGWVSDRLQAKWGPRVGRAGVAAGAMLAGAAFLGLGLLGRGPAWIVPCFTLALGVMGFYEAAAWTLAIELGGPRGGTSAGLVNTGGNLGGSLSPTVTPWLSKHFGWQVGIGAGGLVCLLAVLGWIWIKPPAADPSSPRSS
jgi:ACS family glucarate transporter-like MFS transporter